MLKILASKSFKKSSLRVYSCSRIYARITSDVREYVLTLLDFGEDTLLLQLQALSVQHTILV